METTKELILIAALRLFAKNGYEAVSTRQIAGQLGMTKGALYKHYKNKRDIFDSIVSRMRERDLERAREFGVPKDSLSKETEESYRDTALEKIKAFSIAQFRYWTKDEFASSFRKMLTLEQYRNQEIADLLRQYLISGVITHTQDLMREVAKLHHKGGKDPQILALEYFAPIYMMMNFSDGIDDKEEAVLMVEKHINYFMESMR
ncbi:MAG: TetR/AcrR family transcriptional regulator [Holophagales bacterium]|jgi:AcrR family transcriptional regulator|nr:TetR/AcrR family transcriptional regulator [Holophagales bacterium]